MFQACFDLAEFPVIDVSSIRSQMGRRDWIGGACGFSGWF
jgi:hypothetical protein